MLPADNDILVREAIASGESIHVEFKEARGKLPSSLYETICAFLNRDGGKVLLGVRDNGSVSGVDPQAVRAMRQDLANALNNPQKLSPPFYISVQEARIEGSTVLLLHVPPSSQVHRCKGRIYDRNEQGDYDITDNQGVVAQLYLRKQSIFTENTVFQYARLSDLRPDLIARVRKMAAARQPNHPWSALDDQELLLSAQLWKRDLQQNVEGITLAGILLFGRDEAILSALPHHRTDAIVRRWNLDRYDDRDDIRTNLLESYERLLSFGEKHLPDPFYLEGDTRISLRSILMREIVGNLLIHREYTHPFPAKLVIEQDRIYTENGNRAHGTGTIDPRRFSPYPKNPVIARVFREIGWAEELGSGVRNLYNYAYQYTGEDPQLIEGDIFYFKLPFASDSLAAQHPSVREDTPSLTYKMTEKPIYVTEKNDDLTEKQPKLREKTASLTEKTSEMTEKTSEMTEKTGQTTGKKKGQPLLDLLRENPQATIEIISQQLEISQSTVERRLRSLKKSGKLRRVGPDKGGHWEVLNGHN